MTMISFSHEVPESADYFKLFETSGWNQDYQVDEQQINQALNSSWQVVSASMDQQLVGVGRVVSDGVLYAMIYDLIVHPDYQQQGIGSKILNQILDKCQQANIRSIQLFSAKGKHGFYQKRGFIKRPEDADGMTYQPGL